MTLMRSFPPVCRAVFASIVVQSQDGAFPVMVERSMYWNNRGAGTNTAGGYSD